MNGPVLKVCPCCGEEIPTLKRLHIYGNMTTIFIPVRFCPKCRTSLEVPDRSARSRDQACLPGGS